MKYLKNHRVKNIGVISIIIMEAAVGILTSVLLVELLNSVVAQNLARLLTVIILCILAWGVRLILIRYSNIAAAAIKADLLCELRSDISKCISAKPQPDFNSLDKGEYLSWYTSDAAQIEEKGFTAYYALIGSCAQFVFSIIALITFHWSIALVSVALAIIMFYAPKLLEKPLQKATLKLSEKQAVFVNQIKDVVSGINTVRAFNIMPRFLNTAASASREIENSRLEFTKVSETCDTVILGINILCQFGVNILVAVLSLLKIVPIGTILGAGNLLGAVFNSLAVISRNILTINSSKVLFSKFEYINMLAPVKMLDCINTSITAENLCFAYSEKPVLNNLNLCFEKGKKYAITGASGGGKSTVLKLITKQLINFKGEIKFDNVPINSLAEADVYSCLAYIPQETFLFNTTIKDNITLGITFTQSEITAALRDSSLLSDIEKMPMGLDTPVGESGQSLSGGQRQRIAIARAIIHKRTVLLLDEATSALDKANADSIESVLLQNPSLTIILISHHLTADKEKAFDKIYKI